jgi:two-component system, NarL family, response regulator NreC
MIRPHLNRVTRRVRILVCDDHALFAEGVKAILRDDRSIEVVGQAGEGRQAVELARKLRPDIVLMDIEMPGLNGFEATRLIKKADDSIKVIVLTMHKDEEVVARCLDAGASGYVLKDVPPSQLIDAIHAVEAGGKYMSPEALKRVIDRFVVHKGQTKTNYDLLTAREREVLKLLADGLTVKQIAAQLNLSVKTVDVHKYNLMAKLDIHDRSELIKYAIQRGLIHIPS